MLIEQLLPIKFILCVVEITLAGLILVTRDNYPNNITQISFIIGCLVIILFSIIQIWITFVGINIFKSRIHFENLFLNGIGTFLLIWFILSNWDQSYIWYIWGFSCVYPIFNQVHGLISTICHSKKVIFEKYRAKT